VLRGAFWLSSIQRFIDFLLFVWHDLDLALHFAFIGVLYAEIEFPSDGGDLFLPGDSLSAPAN